MPLPQQAITWYTYMCFSHKFLITVYIVVNNVVLVTTIKNAGILVLQYQHIDEIGYINIVIFSKQSPYACSTIYIMMGTGKITGERGRGMYMHVHSGY